MIYWSLSPQVFRQLQLRLTWHLPQFSQISTELGLGYTILVSFSVNFFNLHGWDCTMVIIQVLNDTCKFAVVVAYVRLELTLEELLIYWIKYLLLEDVFCFHHMAPLFHLVRMLLDPPWYFCYICGRWHWRRLWNMGHVFNFLPRDRLVCGFLHCKHKDTMMSST